MADTKLVGHEDGVEWRPAVRNYDRYDKCQAVATGTLKNIAIKSDRAADVKVAIYSDNAGDIGNVLAQIGSTAIVSGWNYIPIANISIIAGTYYWLAHICNSDAIGEQDWVGAGIARRGISRTFSTFSFVSSPGYNYQYTGRDWAIAGWGELPSIGCPRQAMYFKMMG
jgi:hypothetical protein